MQIMLLASVVLAILLSGCGKSSCESAGREEFRKKYPTYTIIDVVPDGHEGGVSYVAHFKKPNDDKIYFAYISGEVKNQSVRWEFENSKCYV